MKDQHSRLLQRLNGTEDELRIVTDELSERLTQVNIQLFLSSIFAAFVQKLCHFNLVSEPI